MYSSIGTRDGWNGYDVYQVDVVMMPLLCDPYPNPPGPGARDEDQGEESTQPGIQQWKGREYNRTQEHWSNT